MSRAKILSLAQYVLACSAGILWLAASGFSQSITVSPLSNPPNTTTLVSGSGFSAGADVDIYFDATDLALAVTDDTGSFSRIALHVPASALPGEHTVTAKDRSTGASAQTPFRVDMRWAQFRKRPSRDGHNLGENVLSPATVGGLSLLWSSTPHGDSIDYSSPAVANGVVYWRSSDGNAYALYATTGALLWNYPIGYFIGSTPAVAKGVVYFGSNPNFYALNARTGALLWKYRTASSIFTSPAVANGVVYIGSSDWNVYALKASTGALLWKYTTDSSVLNSPPAVANGVVYAGNQNGNVYALNASMGTLLWKYSTGRSVETSPAVGNGVVVFGGGGGVYALNALTGRVLWKRTGPSSISTPALANGLVYVASQDTLYARNGRTGAVVWKYTGSTPP